MDERETYWKQYYLTQFNNDWSKVLFFQLIDGKGGKKSKETRDKQSLGLKKVYKSKKRKPYWEGKKRTIHAELMKEISGFKYRRTKAHKKQVSSVIKDMWSKKGKEIGKKISQNKIGKGVKKIICNETQEIFNSLKECSLKMNISEGCICSFCKGKYPYPTLRGYTFKYYLAS